MIYFQLLRPHGIDFPQLYEGAKMWLMGLNPYQTLLTSPGPYNYPPPSLLFLAPFALGDFFPSAVIWNVTSLVSYLVSIFILTRLSPRFSFPSLATLTFLFTLPFFPEKFNLGNGQINNFILLLCVLTLWFWRRGRRTTGALLLAAATVIKIVPGFFLIAFIWLRDWSFVRRYLALVATLFWLPALVMPPQFYQMYLSDIFFRGLSLEGKAVYYNQSLLGFLTRNLPLSQVSFSYYVLALLLVSVSVYTVWRRQISQPFRLFALAVSLYLILHPLTWQHHFVFAIIPLTFLFSHRQWLTFVFSYLLIATNIKHPALIPAWGQIITSHQFFGALLAWSALLFTTSAPQVAGRKVSGI